MGGGFTRLCTPGHHLCVFILFATVKTAALFKLLDQGVGITDGLIAVWDAETQALFAAVMSFWFGQRALAKFRLNR